MWSDYYSVIHLVDCDDNHADYSTWFDCIFIYRVIAMCVLLHIKYASIIRHSALRDPVKHWELSGEYASLKRIRITHDVHVESLFLFSMISVNTHHASRITRMWSRGFMRQFQWHWDCRVKIVPDYIRFYFYFYKYIKYQFLNIHVEDNQQYFNIVDLHFVKSL